MFEVGLSQVLHSFLRSFLACFCSFFSSFINLFIHATQWTLFYWSVTRQFWRWRLSRNEKGEETASNTKQSSLNRDDNQHTRPIKLSFSAPDQKSGLSNIICLPFLTSFKVFKVILTWLFVNLIYDKRESGHVLGKAFPLFSVEFYIWRAKVDGLNTHPSLFAIKKYLCFFLLVASLKLFMYSSLF